MSTQAQHLWLLGGHLACLAIASLSGIAWVLPARIAPTVYTSGAAVLALGILLRLADRSLRLESAWYDCRAVAESVKTLSWRYMMGAAPYPACSTVAGDEERLAADISRLLETSPGAEAHLARIDSPPYYLTQDMQRLRAASLAERKRAYVTERLCDQIQWYRSKAQSLRRKAAIWFGVSTGLEILVVLALVGFVSHLGVALGSVAITMASLSLVWLQTKRYSELSHAYTHAYQALCILRPLLEQSSDDATFAHYVAQVEEAVSREHTMWIDRRTA